MNFEQQVAAQYETENNRMLDEIYSEHEEELQDLDDAYSDYLFDLAQDLAFSLWEKNDGKLDATIYCDYS